jgi:hypothetical protein
MTELYCVGYVISKNNVIIGSIILIILNKMCVFFINIFFIIYTKKNSPQNFMGYFNIIHKKN